MHMHMPWVQVEAAVDRMIKKLERDEAALMRDEEDGRPYVDVVGKKGAHRAFKMRGLPCTEWFEGNPPPSARNVDAEAAVRAARQAIKVASAHAVAPPVQLPLSWVPPGSRGRDWNTICLRLGPMPF